MFWYSVYINLSLFEPGIWKCTENGVTFHWPKTLAGNSSTNSLLTSPTTQCNHIKALWQILVASVRNERQMVTVISDSINHPARWQGEMQEKHLLLFLSILLTWVKERMQNFLIYNSTDQKHTPLKPETVVAGMVRISPGIKKITPHYISKSNIAGLWW